MRFGKGGEGNDEKRRNPKRKSGFAIQLILVKTVVKTTLMISQGMGSKKQDGDRTWRVTAVM